MSSKRYLPLPSDSIEIHCLHLMEECAELQQAVAKLSRFGPDGYHPLDPHRETNRAALLREYEDVRQAVQRLLGRLNQDV